MRNAAKIGGTVTKKKKYYDGGGTGDPKKSTTGTPPPTPSMGKPIPAGPGVRTRPLTPPSSKQSRIAEPPVQTSQDRWKAEEAARKAAAKAAREKANNAAFNERMDQLSKEAGKTKTPKPYTGVTGYSKGGRVKKKMASGGAVIQSPIQTRLGNKPIAGGNMAKGGALKKVNPAANPGLAELPTPVRNKMGYAKKGGAHPGFKAVQAKIAAKQGVSKKAAGAILAAGARKASGKAKAANPRLKRVKG